VRTHRVGLRGVVEGSNGIGHDGYVVVNGVSLLRGATDGAQLTRATDEQKQRRDAGVGVGVGKAGRRRRHRRHYGMKWHN
jgi:hypothetical protein